jgi:hypothetical protein
MQSQNDAAPPVRRALEDETPLLIQSNETLERGEEGYGAYIWALRYQVYRADGKVSTISRVVPLNTRLYLDTEKQEVVLRLPCGDGDTKLEWLNRFRLARLELALFRKLT